MSTITLQAFSKKGENTLRHEQFEETTADMTRRCSSCATKAPFGEDPKAFMEKCEKKWHHKSYGPSQLQGETVGFQTRKMNIVNGKNRCDDIIHKVVKTLN